MHIQHCPLSQYNLVLVKLFSLSLFLSQTLVTGKICMTEDIISDALDKLRGAIMIVYPMNLPPYDPISLEFEGKEDLSGTQVRVNVIVACTCNTI